MHGAFRNQMSATLEITDHGSEVASGNEQWVTIEVEPIDPSSVKPAKKKRLSGGSNLMPEIENALSSQSNWYEISTTSQYQYPGVCPQSTSEVKFMGHVTDCTQLAHYTGSNEHFLYNENQLSKAHYNDNKRTVTINGKTSNVHIRYAQCRGVLKCTNTSCSFAASMNTKKCPLHPTAQLIPSGQCPVYVVYVYPVNYKENHERWVAGLTLLRAISTITHSLNQVRSLWL